MAGSPCATSRKMSVLSLCRLKDDRSSIFKMWLIVLRVSWILFNFQKLEDTTARNADGANNTDPVRPVGEEPIENFSFGRQDEDESLSGINLSIFALER